MKALNNKTTRLTLTIVVVVGLLVDAYVHFHLASRFAQNRTSTLSEPELFRAEATGALIAAVLVAVRLNRSTAALAALVAGGGTVAVVLYRYVDVGRLGPIPNMYDPFWGPPEKAISLVAEAVATLAALALFAWSWQTATAGASADEVARTPSNPIA